MNLDDLAAHGFELVTEWILKGPKIGPRTFDWKDDSGWLYAFVIKDQVQYIGLTTRVLRSRMSDYSHITNSQTVRIRELIFAALSGGESVLVYGLKQRNETELKAHETRLLNQFRPPWNRA
jgi:excinuclease UvrABC nuclease subunit